VGPEETYGTSRWWHWDRRLDLLIPKKRARELFSHSRCHIPIYPEAVALAELLASPTWRTLAGAETGSDERYDFTVEAGYRLGLNEYHPTDDKHPLVLWAEHHAGQPPIQPARTFPDRRRNSLDGTAKPSTRAVEKHHDSARIFAKRRLAANALTYHHHTNAPIIETYYPRPGPYARQRARLAEQTNSADHRS
jgi:hypothetical protein